MENEPDTITLSIDVMGGDFAPNSPIEGASVMASEFSDVHFKFFGNKNLIKKIILKYPSLSNRHEVIHTEDKILDDDKPSQALRQGKNSSMYLALESIKKNEADAVVSGGNTGAYMGIAKILLRTLSGIDRPAMCSLIPTQKGLAAMLDLGANIECDSKNLFQFTIMGEAFARVILKKDKPSVALLNVGTEEMKGNDVVRSALQTIKNSTLDINFVGFCEGTDINKGEIDVIVTDGFTGNIALKTSEGTAKLSKYLLKNLFKDSIIGMFCYLLMKNKIKKLRDLIDPNNYNGAMLLGLNGIAIKSHGNSDAKGYYCAIKNAYELAKHKINDKITEEILSVADEI